MADPSDDVAIAEIETGLGVPVLPAVAMRADLSALIGQMYGGPAPDGEAAAPRVTLDDLLLRVLAEGGSDPHLTVGSAPAMRVQGELRRIEGRVPRTRSVWHRPPPVP